MLASIILVHHANPSGMYQPLNVGTIRDPRCMMHYWRVTVLNAMLPLKDLYTLEIVQENKIQYNKTNRSKHALRARPRMKIVITEEERKGRNQFV